MHQVSKSKPEAEVIKHVDDVAGIVLVLLPQMLQYSNLFLGLPVKSLFIANLQSKGAHLKLQPQPYHTLL
jgi:hypothetical protein